MKQFNEISSTVIFNSNDGMGKADHQLQHKLIGIYLSLLMDGSQLPATICLDTEGVKFVIEGSSVLTQLNTLGKKASESCYATHA